MTNANKSSIVMSFGIDAEFKPNRKVKRARSIGALEVGSGNSQIDNENGQTEQEQLFEPIFSIPLVLKQILMNLDREDLLQTSLVNKNWNFFSREVLRENEKCMAVVEGKNFCHNLNELIALLQKSETVPFNGMSLAVPMLHDPNHECASHADVFELMSIINIKYLSLQIHNDNESDCIALECVREILVETASLLKELRLIRPPYSSKTFSEIIGLDLQGQWLPSLSALEFPTDSDLNDSSSIIKELVEASPKLQKLYGSMDSECLGFILPSKAARAVREFHFEAIIDSLRNCAAFSQENPRLEKFSFSTNDEHWPRFSVWSEFHQNEVSNIVKQLLKCSRDSLKNFACSLYDLILMTSQWNIPVLKEVTHFQLRYDNCMDEVDGYRTLRKIDWAKYFPNLKEVQLSPLWLRDLDRDFYVKDTFRESNAQFVCESVKIFHCWLSNVGTIQMSQNIFPNLKEVHLKSCQAREFHTFLNALWTGWLDLELIDASVYIGRSIPNYDFEFLGISEEEAAYLLENVDDLASLEIVPTRPSIFNLQKLKKFVIQVGHDYDLCRKTDSTADADTVFLSRLAGQCAFGRIPGLEVKIYPNVCEPMRNCQFAFEHLKPFTFVK